jgi:phosphoribosylaminoimidazolecarboxamide formyltransferase/IMP cyclohydrolase
MVWKDGIPMQEVKQALISVYDKFGLEEFARGLSELGTKIISTGGTAKFLREKGIPVEEINEVTKFPEILGGRVKTLHPAIHAGILARRDNAADMETLADHQISTIDLVVVNLYPFREAVAKPGVTIEKVLENIDIGGQTLLRAAAKNFRAVGVVVNPDRYGKVLSELRATGSLSERTREELAVEAFAHASAYDLAIHEYLEEVHLHKSEDNSLFPIIFQPIYRKSKDLIYGENPHQRGALYGDIGIKKVPGVAFARQLHGKEISFNNFADLDAGWNLMQEFEEPTVAIIKHQNPCGVACRKDLLEAYRKAYSCDPTSAYGGVIVVNRLLDETTAKEIVTHFFEAIIATGYEAGALETLKGKKNLRILEFSAGEGGGRDTTWQLMQISGGMLVQEKDAILMRWEDMKFVTRKKPSEEELEDLIFALKVAKHVKSNAISLARGKQTVGIGAGQMSRIDSLDLAVRKAGERANGSVLASDGFFPFPDSIHRAAEAGVTAIIQPGGSIRDSEVIKAADEHGIALVVTDIRHFRH